MNLPQRKHVRLKDYDYGQPGAYFVTICAHERQKIFAALDAASLTPSLSPIGKLAEEQLLALLQRFPCLKLLHYVIMPNHIHLLLQIEEAAGASPRPTLTDIICAYKSLTALAAKALTEDKIFQSSFYEHVVRGEKELAQVIRYIEDNPAKWQEDKYFS